MEGYFKEWISNPMVIRWLIVFVGISVIIIIARLFQRSLPGYVKDPDMRYRARKFITAIGYLAGFLMVVAVFSDRLGNLTVALGVAGAGIAFALQEVITSIAGWIAVSFGHFYRSGDRIQLGGITGDVIDIGILRTTLMECGDWVKGDQYNGRIVRVSNGSVFKDPVFNYSGDFPFLWDEIVVPVRYGSDSALARRILGDILEEVVGEYAAYASASWVQIVKKYKIDDAKVEPAVTLTANENWMEFTLRYVVDYKERRDRKNRIFTRILEEFKKFEGSVGIASTSTDINLLNTPPFDVRISERK